MCEHYPPKGEVNGIQLSPEGEVNSGKIPRREGIYIYKDTSRYISSAVHRP